MMNTIKNSLVSH